MRQQIQFSEREKQVIGFLIQGRSNKQIALALGVSLRTVEFHLSNIYAKLGVTSRTEAALKLSKTNLRESAGGELRESTVVEMDGSDHNIGTYISTRRIPMNKSFLIGLVILILTSVFCLGNIYLMAKERGSTQEMSLNSTNAPTTAHTSSKSTATFVSTPTHYLEFVNLSDLQQAAKFPIWLPTYIPDNLPFYKGWISDYANGDEHVRLVYSEAGDSPDANPKSLDIQMEKADEIISMDSITEQSKVIVLDVREVQVHGQTGFTYWTESLVAGNSAYLVWREGTINFSVSLSGDWPQPDESNPHGLDNMLLTIARSLRTKQ